MTNPFRSQTFTGITMALTSCILWSFNFVIARGIHDLIPPISFAMYRWSFAALVLAPFVWRKLMDERAALIKNRRNVIMAGLTGITFYSPLIYIAGHYSPALNLALIGTTASPVFTFILAGIFLHEKMRPFRIIGLFICITGIILLLSKGSLEAIMQFRFSTGDRWMLGAALSFSIYNITVRKKARTISPVVYLFASFIVGIIGMLPAYVWEISHGEPVKWSLSLGAIIMYSGAGTSVIAFFCWNGAISRIGSARTAVFANMIPVLSSLEAVWLLREPVSIIQFVSMTVVTVGLALATSKK